MCEGKERCNRLVMANKDFMHILCPMLNTGKSVRIRVKGMSMYPLLINERDLVDIRQMSTPKKGDVVLVRVNGNQYVLHRIVCKVGEQLTLMGDGNLLTQEVCECSDVIGKVVLIIRNGRAIDPEKMLCTVYGGIWMKLIPLKRSMLGIRNFFRTK